MKSQTFGERIKKRREELGYSLKQVSAKLNYSASSLSKIEKNQRVAPEKIVKPLSLLLNIDYKELMIKRLSENVFYNVKDSNFAQESLKIALERLKKEGRGTQIEKNKEEIIQSIKSYFVNKPIEKAWIFGSLARKNSFSHDSDIDILVQFKRPNKITLFDIIDMKNELGKLTGREIDLVESGQELKSIKKEIQKEKILIYESQPERFGTNRAHDRSD